MPGILSVQTKGFEHAVLRLAEAEIRFPLAPRRIVDEGSDIVLDFLKLFAPKRTGRLARGLGKRVEGTRAHFTSRAPYSRPVIHGARPHEILAGRYTGRSTKRALVWPGAAHPVPAVFHPGNRPNPFPREAMEAARPLILELSRQVAREIFG